MRYIKTIGGKTIIQDGKSIVVYKDDLQTINPSHDMLIGDGWSVYEEPLPTEVETLDHAREDLRNAVLEYDQSDKVNSFSVGGFNLWLDKATRAGLMLRFQAEMAIGQESTTLWYNGISFPLPMEDAMQMLYALELYASACYDNTQRHLANVDALQTIEEIEEYDYTTGYPDKLTF